MSTTVMHESRDTPVYGAMFNIDAIRRANHEAGFYFFEPDTLRFFRSRVLPNVYGGRLFVTSEQRGFEARDGRGYTVREFMPDGSIEEIGEFNEHASSRAAQTAAKRAAKDTHDYYFDGQHGKGGRKVVYVVTGANDPWHALERLHKNFRVQHMGRAQDYMMAGQHADHYVKVAA